MVCNMCDNDGNPCDRCKMYEQEFDDFDEEDFNKQKKKKEEVKIRVIKGDSK